MSQGKDAGYARPDILVETAWLAERLQRPETRVVDMGAHEGYLRAHIPGAVHPGPDRSNFLKNPKDPIHVMPPDAFARLMGEWGIGDGTEVVAYDSDGGHTAARLWWVMRYHGNDRCKIVNGGWPKWLAEGRPITMAIPRHPPAVFTPRIVDNVMCTMDRLKRTVAGESAVTILDVRSDGEWDGSVTRGNKRPGRIPGAVHLDWHNFVTNDALMTFKPADELRRLLAAHGIKKDKPTFVY